MCINKFNIFLLCKCFFIHYTKYIFMFVSFITNVMSKGFPLSTWFVSTITSVFFFLNQFSCVSVSNLNKLLCFTANVAFVWRKELQISLSLSSQSQSHLSIPSLVTKHWRADWKIHRLFMSGSSDIGSNQFKVWQLCFSYFLNHVYRQTQNWYRFRDRYFFCDFQAFIYCYK